VLVDKLGLVISREKNAEVVDCCHEALKFDAVYQKKGGRDAVLDEMLQEHVLKLDRALDHWVPGT